MINRYRGLALAVPFGIVAALFTAQANAAGFQLKEQSAEGLGNAFAGSTAKAYDPSTIFYNAAGMTRLKGNQGQQNLSYIAPKAEFKGTSTQTPINPATGLPTAAPTVTSTDGEEAGKAAFVPAAYAFWDFSDDLKFGLNVNVPFGLETNYDSDWIGRAHAIRSNLEVIDVGVNAAYKVTPQLSIGGGVFVEYAKATLSSGYHTPFGNTGFSRVKGDSWGFGYNVSALYEFSDATRAGINYRSRVQHELDGDVTYSLPIAPAGLINSNGSAKLTLPDVLSVGVYHDINDKFAVMADAAWTNWSLFKRLNVDPTNPSSKFLNTPENWKDTYFVSLGTTYTHSDQLKFQFGVAYDKGAATDEYRTARIPDEDRYWLAAGVEYEIKPGFTWNLSYSHIFVSDAKLDEAGIKGTNGAQGIYDSLQGSYDSSIDIISLSGTLKF